MKTLAP